MTRKAVPKIGMALTMMLAFAAHAGPVLHVDDDAPPGGDGATWDTAYRFLQDALSDASEGGITEIRVGQGTYLPDRDEANPKGTGNRHTTFHLINGVALMGGYAGLGAKDPDLRDIDLYKTILSGDLLGDDGPDFANNEENSYHVTTGSGTDDTAILDGFTITAGNADAYTSPNRFGGGMFNAFGSPTLANCTLSGNWAGYGGGIYNENDSNPTLTDCTFSGNSATYGGGMYNDQSNPILKDCTFAGNQTIDYFTYGGGMYNNNSSPTLASCTFSGNTSLYGGGVYSDADSSPMLTDCSFTDNSAGSGGGVIVSGTAMLSNCTFTGNSGGGMSAAGSATIIDCTFISNSASYGGAMSLSGSAMVINCAFAENSATLRGGALYAVAGNPMLVNCTVAENTAGLFGGGIFNSDDSAASLISCVVKNNTADFGGGMHNFEANPTLTDCTLLGNTANVWGGAMYSAFSEVAMTNCTLSGNSAVGSGGAVYNFQCSPVLANCTFSRNSAGEDGGGIFNQLNANPALTNCILWQNTDSGPTDESAQIFHLAASQSVVNYSCVYGWTGDLGGIGNIGDDPQFVDADGPDDLPGTEDDDLRLMSGSPCIDAGNNWGVPIDAGDYDEDGNTAELFPVDLDGNPRFNADELDFDPGCGVPVVVDMGAYEYQFDPVDEVIFADLNGDGAVTTVDLLALLAGWGDPGNNCLADLDIDGSVGILDLLILLANWSA